MTRIAVNKSIDIKRKRDRRQEEQWDPSDLELQMSKEADDAMMGLLEAERNKELREKVERLPEGHRRIVTEFYLEGKSHEQIAEELGVTLKTVESKLYRARAYIRDHWSRGEWE